MMRGRVRGMDSVGGPGGWWASIPPVTKLLGCTWAVSALAFKFQLLGLRYLYLAWDPVWRNMQVWRLVTNFAFLGTFSGEFLFRMLWLFMYGPPLEKLSTQHNPGDFAFMLLFSMSCLDLISLAAPSLHMTFCSGHLLFTIIYVWARNHHTQDVSVWGLFTIKAFYLPWVLLAIDVVFGRPFSIGDLIGIGVGHLYYFVTTLHPLSTGRVLIRTPVWLSNFMAPYYNSINPGTTGQGGGARGGGTGGGGGGFRAFQGRGRRLAD